MTNKVYQGCTHLFPIVFVQCTKTRSIVKQDSQNSKSLIPNWFKVYVKLEFVIIIDWSQKVHYVIIGVFIHLKMFGSKCEDIWMQQLRCLDWLVCRKCEQTFNVFPSKRVNNLEGSPMASSQQMKCSRWRRPGEHCILALLPVKDNIPLTQKLKGLNVQAHSSISQSADGVLSPWGHRWWAPNWKCLHFARELMIFFPPRRRPRAAAPGLRRVPSLSVDEIWDWQCV